MGESSIWPNVLVVNRPSGKSSRGQNDQDWGRNVQVVNCHSGESC